MLRSTSAPADVLVVGGGLVGLATALRLLEARPAARVVLLEQEPAVAAHQSSHNSGVLHAGVYYAPGSLKARLCREGADDLRTFAAAHGIPVRERGKVVVATRDDERPRLAALAERAQANGVRDVAVIGPDRLREIEPHVRGLCALHSPHTAVVDFARVAAALAAAIVERGGAIRCGERVTALRQARAEVIARTASGSEVAARTVVTCGGVWADRLLALTGADDLDPRSVRVLPFRGAYAGLAPRAAERVRGLVYPVPDPALPFLGVHLTRHVDDSVTAGPTATLTLSRRGGGARDALGALVFPGLYRLLARYPRAVAVETWRGATRATFLRAVRQYLPDVEADDLLPGPAGIRAQLVDRAGRLVDDFVFARRDRVLHVVNAPSPAATASLAIGRVVAQTALERLA